MQPLHLLDGSRYFHWAVGTRVQLLPGNMQVSTRAHEPTSVQTSYWYAGGAPVIPSSTWLAFVSAWVRRL